MPERGVGTILVWHEAVAELFIEIPQLFKLCVPNGCHMSLACSPVETNTIECSNIFSCRRSWLFFRVIPESLALVRNANPKRLVLAGYSCLARDSDRTVF